MDPHLEAVPRLGALTTGRLARGDLEHFGGQAHGALDAQVLAFGAADQFGRDYSQSVLWLSPLAEEEGTSLESCHLARRQGDADAVDFGTFPELALVLLVVRHCGEEGRKDRLYLDC